MIEVFNIIPWTAGLVFLYAAWSDFQRWRIPNGAVLALIAVYALGAALKLLVVEDVGATLFSLSGIGGDVGAGLLLFTLGVVLWAFRLFGAGDAKLFLPIGLFVGWHGMLPFAIFLLIGGILTMLALKVPMPLAFAHYAVAMRIEEIRVSRKIPYGVIMVLATLVTMAFGGHQA
ncbi:pilus assembly protein CpaA [Ensifer adhaerens]|uniref:prepilin peptidase n=1 Tax=Ensifer adhaerens TaxID=106592 RepID=UPI001CBB6965|nr:prepilin peptidase [Ensifer adhaerens]MBZ7925971.1 pilus assembly protein CpaA [Ensifer adhaerens]UAX94876.1 pilus assembly protein CpaA [Ensifer adhaerens]UAY03233.1 pilus assembly protein CpaA [Ensifer adhaerens]UAY11218.1 pilus assembly protein CpaA [Ensifer adhaerens]